MAVRTLFQISWADSHFSDVHPITPCHFSDHHSPSKIVPAVISLTLPHCSLHQSPLKMVSEILSLTKINAPAIGFIFSSDHSFTLSHFSPHQSPLKSVSSRYPYMYPACSAYHPALKYVHAAVSITPFHLSDHHSPLNMDSDSVSVMPFHFSLHQSPSKMVPSVISLLPDHFSD